MSLSHLKVTNFRCIKELDLDLPPFFAVIGPNGAGKSSLLASIQAFNDLGEQRLHQMITNLGGFDATVCWASTDTFIHLETTIPLDEGNFRYSITLHPNGPSFNVANEELTNLNCQDTDSPKNVIPFYSHPVNKARRSPHHESTLKDCMTGSAAFDVLYVFKAVEHYRPFDLNLRILRRPQVLEPTQFLSKNGDNLLSVLYNLKSTNQSGYDEFLELLRVAYPDVERLDFPLAGKGYASLNWYEKKLERPLDAQQLSDGTLRLLYLATLLHTAQDSAVILIDEPEVSLHPQWLMFLVSLMRQTSARAQIIVATQSDQLVRWLEPHELLVADLEDGVSRFRWGSDMDLDEWLKEYTLDRLWLMGELGGRR